MARVPDARLALLMEFRRKDVVSGPQITGFSGRGFRLREPGQVEDTLSAGGILLTPLSVQAWDTPPAPEALTIEDFAALLDSERRPEFVLLGTGNIVSPPPSRLARALDAQGIGIEAMDSRAAARAWGVLRAEDRWIVAALMLL